MTAGEGSRVPPIIGIVGWKNSGKTTLAVRLISELTRRGYRVSSVKHAHHAFQIDDGDTDSAKHRKAGAAQVAIVSSKRWAMVTELRETPEPAFAEVIGSLDPCDLVVVEGYKWEPIPKIEARRQTSAERPPLADADSHIVAIATEQAVNDGRLPVFQLDDVPAIADFVVDRLALRPRR